MHILNKRFGDAGLRDTVVQSSIVAEGSVDMALRGKAYNRGVRTYKIVYEAMLRLVMPYVEEQVGDELMSGMRRALEVIDKDFTREAYMEVSTSVEFQKYVMI